jgi:hypothetical protein
MRVLDADTYEIEIRLGQDRLFYGKGLVSADQAENLRGYLSGKTRLRIRTDEPDHKPSIELVLGEAYKSQSFPSPIPQTALA